MIFVRVFSLIRQMVDGVRRPIIM